MRRGRLDGPHVGNKAEPAVRRYPRIRAFLGYDPFPPPRKAGERLVALRRKLGFSRKRAAKILGVDEMKLARWEQGETEPSAQYVAKLEALLFGK